MNIKKNIISNLFLVSTFLMPLFNNSLLIADINKDEKLNIENEFNQDDINIWLKLLKRADTLKEKGLINEAEELYNSACNMLHQKKYATFIVEDIGNHYSNLINKENYKELNSELISEIESICGKDNLNTIFSLNRIADTFSKKDLNEAASELFLFVIDFKEKNPKNYIELERSLAKDYISLGIAYVGMAKYKKAREQFLKATEINEKDYGKKNSEYAYSYSLLGWSYTLSGEYEKAQNILEEALEIKEKELGKDHPDLVHYLRFLALNNRRKGEFDIAIEIYLRGLKNSKDFYGENDINLVSYYEDLGWTYGFQGYLLKSEEMYRKAISIQSELLGEDHTKTIYNLRNIADIYLKQFKYDEAEEIYIKSLKVYEKINDKFHQAGIYGNLASVYSDQGRYKKAIESTLKQKKIHEEIFGTNSITYPTILLRLATLYLNLGDYKNAYELREKSLILREKILGEEHPDFITSLASASLFYLNIGKYKKGSDTFTRASDLANKHLYFGSPENARVIETLSIYLRNGGAYDTSNEMLEIVKDIQEYNLGKDHFLIARTYESMARNYMNLYKYKDAIEYFTNSLKIREKTLGSEHPSNYSILKDLANANLKNNDFIISSFLFRESIKKILNTAQRELPYVPDSERISFINSLDNKFPSEIYEAAFKSDLFSELILFLRLNRQGLIGDIEKRQARLAKSDIDSQELVKKIKIKTNQLSKFNLSFRERKAILKEKEELEKKLFKSLPKIQTRIVEISEVAKNIPQDGILIEFQKYQMDKNWYYLALTLNPNSEINIVHLGSASLIENKIKKAIKASEESLNDADKLWNNVGESIVGPLEKIIKNKEILFISPDAELNRIPFSGLASFKENNYLSNMKIRLITTGRDLLELYKNSETFNNKPLVVADPNFDKRFKPLELNHSISNKYLVSQKRSREFNSQYWRQLPGTSKEGQIISEITNAELLDKDKATSLAIQQKISPKIIHIASHSYYMADKKGLENPLLRSGIVLAGANQPDLNPNDDGYLLALEVAKLEWEGTQMAVISGCESGIGDIQSGEGVYGLKRSIAVAGARSSLLSLWKVNDIATAAFMESFYLKLKNGEGRAEALASTQKEFRNHSIPGYRHPHVWAAFQLSGDWRPIDF